MKAKITHIPNSLYKFIYYLGDAKTHSGQQAIKNQHSESLAEAMKLAEQNFLVNIDDDYGDIISNGWLMATDYICPKCGQSHEMIIDGYGNQVYCHIDGTFNNGKNEFTVKIAKA